MAVILGTLAVMYLTTGGVKSKEQIKVRAGNPGQQSLNLGAQRPVSVEYRGDSALVTALASGEARPLNLSFADFDMDGAPDLVSSYAWGSRAIVTLQRGNISAFAPRDQAIFDRAAKGILPQTFVPNAKTFEVPSADFLFAGDFDRDGHNDVLSAARGGEELYFLAGDGEGELNRTDLALGGKITAITTGVFSHPAGTTQCVIVGLEGPQGPVVRVYVPTTNDGWSSEPVVSYSLPAPATSLQLGLLDEDPFVDIAAAVGKEVILIHGHEIPPPGQKVSLIDPQSRLEHIAAQDLVRTLAVGNFLPDDGGRANLALLLGNGVVQLLQRRGLDEPPVENVAAEIDSNPRQAMTSARSRMVAQLKAKALVRMWKAGDKQEWIIATEIDAVVSAAVSSNSQPQLATTRISARATDDLLLLDAGQQRVKVVIGNELVAFAVESSPVAVLAMPQKFNGERDLVVLTAGRSVPELKPLVPTTFTVNTITDLARSPIANQCNGVANDCSLREAVLKANTISNSPGSHTINIPANLPGGSVYNLSINNPNTPGTTGTIGLPDLQVGSNINRATTLMGTNGTPRIHQTIANNDVITTGFNASSVPVAVNLSLQNLEVTGGTFTGIFVGVDNATGLSNTTINNCNVHNNSNADATFGQGGGIQSATGPLTITNSTIATNSASNGTTGQGGGIAFIILNGSGLGSNGALFIDNTIFSGNSAAKTGNFPAGGGIFVTVAGPGPARIEDSTFTTNAATGGGHGGGIANSSNPVLALERNRFRGNTVAGAGTGTALRNQGSGAVNAENNWWGCDAFPTAAPCDTATASGGAIDSDPRIDLALTANPATICRGTTTTITADVTRNTNGVNVDAGTAPDVLVGLNFTFADHALGTITPPLVVPIPAGGMVARTFTAGGAHGTAMPTVLLDVGTPQAVSILIPDSFTSVQTGNFNVATTWTPQCVPQSDDSVTIASPHTVSLPSNQSIADVTINPGGTLQTGSFTLNVNSTNNQKNYAVVNTWTSNGTLAGTGTIDFNGTVGTQTVAGTTTFFNLTLSGVGGTRNFGTSLNTVANNFITSGGTMNGGTSTFTFTGATGSISGANAKSFFNLVINSGAVIANATGGNTTINNNFTNNGTFTQAAALTTTFAGTTHALAGAGSTTFGIITINTGNTVNAGSHNFNFVGSPFTITGTFNGQTGTVTASGAIPQTIAGAGTKAFNNLVINNPSGVTLSTAASVGGTGTLTLTRGVFTNGANLTLGNGATVSRSGGSLASPPTFTSSVNVIYTAPAPPAAITTGPEIPVVSSVLNNLTINNPSNVILNANAQANGVLTLTAGDLITGVNVLTMPGTATSAPLPPAVATDVVGNVRRTGFVSGGTALSFGNPLNTIQINSGTAPTDITVNLVKAAPSGGGMDFPSAVQRTYTITPTGGSGISATLRLHYLDGELNGNTEANLGLWRFGPPWARQGRTATDTTNNWVELSGITQFSAWTFSSNRNDTTTTITSDNPDPSTINQVVQVFFTVVSNVTGAPPVTGNVTVTVNDGSGNTCTGTVAAGVCNLTLTTLGSKTLTATYSGDDNFNGSSDDEPHLVIEPDITISDASVAEPPSGSTQMLFTIALSIPAPASGVTVNYSTADGGSNPATAGSDYTAIVGGSVTFAPGQQLKTIAVEVLSDADNTETNETLLVNLTGALGGNIVDNQATGTITVANPVGMILISEMRTSGENGAGDGFVEIYNNTDTPHTVPAGGYGLFKKGADCNALPELVGTIPATTVIPARGHYLFAGSSYSLSNYGGTGAAARDQLLTTDIQSDFNVGLFSTANALSISSVNRLDAVGFGSNTGGICDMLKEGTTLLPASGSTAQYSFVRRFALAGNDVPTSTDGNDNAADFTVVSTTPSTPVGSNLTPKLGAPGPENLAGPNLKKYSQVGSALLDPLAPESAPPNRVRDLVVVPNGSLGTISIRRTFTNNTGAPITRLRFRIYDITTMPSPVGTADLRALNSSQIMVMVTGGGTVTVEGTTVETPANQPSGGGLNSSLTGTVTITPLASGASINLQFLFGVQQGGSFRVFVFIEALP